MKIQTPAGSKLTPKFDELAVCFKIGASIDHMLQYGMVYEGWDQHSTSYHETWKRNCTKKAPLCLAIRILLYFV